MNDQSVPPGLSFVESATSPYFMLALALLCGAPLAGASPLKLDPLSRILPGYNVPTSGQYDKADTYTVDGKPWIVRLLPEQPGYLRSVTQNFMDVLLKEFPSSAGWAYASSTNELSDDSILIHTYDAQYGIDITEDPATGKWSRTACLLCQGAEFDVEYRPAWIDPLQDVHWIQVVTEGTTSKVDGAGKTPYYDVTGVADGRRLFDFSIRGGKTQQEWDAELFLVTGPKPSDGPGTITFYGGLHWGWENHNQAPEPDTLALAVGGILATLVFRRKAVLATKSMRVLASKKFRMATETHDGEQAVHRNARPDVISRRAALLGLPGSIAQWANWKA